MKQLYQNLMNTNPARLINGTAAILVILVGVAVYFIPQFDETAGFVISGAIVAIATELTRKNVTPWNASNPLVKYPEDETGKHIQ